MNREFKRRMKREQKAMEKTMARQRAPQGQRRERMKLRQYIREIQSELRRVVWPTPSEVFTYSVVVVFVVSILTGLVFLMDLGFGAGVVQLFRPAAGR